MRSQSTPMSRIILATGNPNKVAELVSMLGPDWSVSPRPGDLPETVEDGETLYDNAAKKARDVYEATGLAALADDTGLFVAGLDGRPGVRSARFAGPTATDKENRELLLNSLADSGDRSAYFETVLVMIGANGSETVVSGRSNGSISASVSGDAGFGYDPVFVPDDGDGRSFAEMMPDEKNAISHRARALQALVAELT